MRLRPLTALFVCLLCLSGPAARAASLMASPISDTPSTPPAVGPVPSSTVALGPVSSDSELPDAPQAQTTQAPASSGQPAASTTPAGPQQTKRILFIVPNFRAVSANEKLPPTTTKEKFKIAFQDSFDYSAFIEVGILAGIGQLQNSEPSFHQGAAGYGRYYWHYFADNTDGNFMTEFIVPTLAREDPRYYTLGHGGLLKRSVYSVSRLLITRNNEGNPTPNFSEIVGNGAAAGISSLYYPSYQQTWTKVGQRWFLAVGIDGLSNLLKEFWPDINHRIFHNKY